jgi:hypothetical protein
MYGIYAMVWYGMVWYRILALHQANQTMKNLSFIAILVAAFLINSCSLDDQNLAPNKSLEQILAGREMAVYNSMLTFRDKKTFDDLALDLSKREKDYIVGWEKRQPGFKSLYSIYEDVIVEEDKFLQQMVKKYGEASEVTRAETGYAAMTKKYLDNGALIINDDELLDMNVTVPYLAPLINAAGFVRVGDEVRQYKRDRVRIILDGDYGKMEDLENVKESNANIHIGLVQRQRVKVSDAGRVQALSSCTSTVGSHRLIGYEEHVLTNEGGHPCPVYKNNFYIQTRSLKKVLGIWGNFSTNQFWSEGCDYSFNRNLWTGPYVFPSYSGTVHTKNYHIVFNYDTGPCTNSTTACTGNGYVVFKTGTSTTRFHTVWGVNGTTCTMRP